MGLKSGGGYANLLDGASINPCNNSDMRDHTITLPDDKLIYHYELQNPTTNTLPNNHPVQCNEVSLHSY
jgi:hypothetical protein